MFESTSTTSLSSAFGAVRTLGDLTAVLEALGAKPQHVRRLWRAWLGRTTWPGDDDETQPKRVRAAVPMLRERLRQAVSVRSRHQGSDPESERLLINLADAQTVESVLLPRRGVCVSTQLGCAVGCVFCMTGKGGLIRQLTDLEIVGQVAAARALRPDTKKVVFMGMGEPSHNLASVMRAVNFLGTYGDFGHKDLVISSVGDERLFKALDESAVRPALAVSLHTIDDEKRRRLVPNGCRMTVDALINAADRWARATGYPVQFEWTLLAGVNDTLTEMSLLAQKLQGRYAMVNFIPVNAVPGSSWHRPEPAQAQAIVRHLRSHGVIATLRESAAQDVDGGCGQLRARVLGIQPVERTD